MNGSIDDYLKQARCAPMNCKIHSWNQMVGFEEPYADDVTRSFYAELPTGYTFNYYMRTSEVFKFSTFLRVQYYYSFKDAYIKLKDIL